jgi:hypothetical protein
MTNTGTAALVALLNRIDAEAFITLDERIPAHADELALAQRLVALGYARRLSPVTPTIHEYALTLSGMNLARL